MAVLESADESGAHAAPRRPLGPTILSGIGILLTGIFIGGAFGLLHRAMSPKVRVGVTTVAAVATPQVESRLVVVGRESAPAASTTITLEQPVVIASDAPVKHVHAATKAKRAPTKEAKPALAKEAKVAPVKETKATPLPPTKAERAPRSDESDRALKAAIGATENTL
jgi:hypothetical protein